MSENEQTAPTGAVRPPQGEHAAETSTVHLAGETETAPTGPDVPWSPPPRRAQPDGTSASARSGRTRARAAARGTDPLARPGRTSAGVVAETPDDVESDAAHPFSGMADQDEPQSGQADDPGRRAWVLWAVIGGALAVVVAAVVAFAMLSKDSAEPATETVTTTMAVPTPTSEPLDRTGATALVQALPGTVRQFVLTTVEPADSLDGALEAWTAAYTGDAVGEDGAPSSAATPTAGETAADGADQTVADVPVPGEVAGSGAASTITVTVGQWEDAGGATAGALVLAAELGEPTSSEDVMVGGEVTGSLSFYPGADASTTTAVWTNGTVAIRAVGPASEIANFATAFGL